MNEDVRVSAINNPEIKRGMSAAGKPWSQAHVLLSNGAMAYIFNPIAIGDKVVQETRQGKDGKEYTNWVKVRPDKNAEVVSLLKQISNKVDQIAAQVGVVEEPRVEEELQLPPDFL